MNIRNVLIIIGIILQQSTRFIYNKYETVLVCNNNVSTIQNTIA